MDTQKNKHVKLAKEYINEVIFHQDLNVVKDVFLQNAVIVNNFGFSLGHDLYMEKLKIWTRAFKNTSLKMIDEIMTDWSIVYNISVGTQQIGDFRGISVSGRTTTLDIMVISEFADDKIKKAYVSVNLDRVVKKLTHSNQHQAKKTVQNPFIEMYDDCFLSTLNCISAKNVRITSRRLTCLCLWFSGKSDTEIGKILGLSPKTVQVHLNTVKSDFRCYSKSELFDKIKYLKLDHLLTECFMYLMIGKPFEAVPILERAS